MTAMVKFTVMIQKVTDTLVTLFTASRKMAVLHPFFVLVSHYSPVGDA